MAAEQRFRDRLAQQFQQAGSRILQLEADSARKDDQIANLNAQIQRMVAANGSNNSSGQGVNLAIQTQINQATTRAMSAENKLKDSVTKFNKVNAYQQQEILRLKKELSVAKSTGLAAEYERLKKSYAALGKQFEAEKKHNSKGAAFPTTGKGKAATADDDEDDEEVGVTGFKQEPNVYSPLSASSTAASPNRPPYPMHAPPAVMTASPFSRPDARGHSAYDSPAQPSPRPSPSLHPSSLSARTASVLSSGNGTSTGPTSLRSASNAKNSSQYMPTPAPSIGNETMQGRPFNQRPRSNAVDHSSSFAKPKQLKRQRQSEEETEIKKELRDLKIKDPVSRASLELGGSKRPQKSSKVEVVNLCETPSPPRTKKRARIETDAEPSSADSNKSSHSSDIEDNFIFKAITSYKDDPTDPSADVSLEFLHSRDDLADAAAALWDSIRELHDAWEEAKGEDWPYEFEVKLKGLDAKQCVSSKLKIEGRGSGRALWRKGHEGRFACGGCVEQGRPCFLWRDDEFWLLPLHEDDRVWPVEEGLEVRYWLNVE